MVQMDLIEAVPNFSTSDPRIIQAIVDSIESVDHTSVLHTDPDKDYNRTVITFVSAPEYMREASIAAIRTAIKLIDMRDHQGEHPRIGAVDVFPLIPLGNVVDKTCVDIVYETAQELGDDLSLPIYCYAKAAVNSDKVILSDIRSGQYEGLEQKLKEEKWAPDFGPAEFNAKSGAMVIGVRDFLIAYNVNLSTDDVSIATKIARRIRTSGYKRADGTRILGTLDGIQAMGVAMFRENRGHFTQVSTNVLDYKSKDSMHHVYNSTSKLAAKYNTEVTGSEIVGLVPMTAILNSLKSYDPSISEDEISTSIDYLGLNDLYQFDPVNKILELIIAKKFNQ